MTRNPSCLISCSHSLPEGNLSVLVGRHGEMNPAERVRCNIAPIAKGHSRAAVIATALCPSLPPLLIHRKDGRVVKERDDLMRKRKDSAYRSGRSPDWLKMKNPDAPAVKREAEEDWGQ
jgi:hypothetical protein